MPEETVRLWVAAFNAHDLDAMLERMALDVVFQPLRLYGSERIYSGHDGVTRWYEQLIRRSLSYTIDLEDVSLASDGSVLAAGDLSIQGVRHAAPFWGVHEVDDEMITAAHHYLTDAGLAERVGLRGPRSAD